MRDFLFVIRRSGVQIPHPAPLDYPGSPTLKPHSNSGRCAFDERAVIGVVLVEARGDDTEELELIEEALHQVSGCGPLA